MWKGFYKCLKNTKNHFFHIFSYTTCDQKGNLKKDPREVLYFSKDSESAIRFFLAYVQFQKNVPKVP